jgi:hypothetical protein
MHRLEEVDGKGPQRLHDHDAMSNDRQQADEQEIDRFNARMFEDMSPAEMEAFDNDVAHDPQLRDRYEAFLEAVDAVVKAGEAGRIDREQLRAGLSAVDRQLDEKRQKWPWWAAAAAAVLAAIGAIWMLLPRDPDTMAEYLLPEPGLPVLMSSANGRGMADIMNSYKLERYEETAALLATALAETPTNDTLRYFAGVVAHRLHGCVAAMDHYSRVAGTRFAERARYHMALCHLQAGDTALARSKLDALMTANDHQVRDLSRRLRERL